MESIYLNIINQTFSSSLYSYISFWMGNSTPLAAVTQQDPGPASQPHHDMAPAVPQQGFESAESTWNVSHAKRRRIHPTSSGGKGWPKIDSIVGSWKNQL